jgi:PAS domain S-box-containing protein
METKILFPDKPGCSEEADREIDRLRDELHRAGEKFSEIYELSPSGYLTLSADHKITELNQSCSHILGMEKSSLIGTEFDVYFQGETRMALRAFYKNMTASRSKEFCEVIIENGTGRPRNIFIEGKVLGRSDDFLLNIVDITAIERSALLLQQTRQNYETFFNSIDELLIVVDTGGRVINTNQAVRDKLGYTETELEGMQIAALHTRARRLEASGLFASALIRSQVSCTVPLITRSGEEIPVETVITKGVWNGNAAIFVVSKDISKIIRTEAQVALATNLAGEIYQPLNIMSMILDKLRFEIESKGSVQNEIFSEKSQRIQENIERIRNFIDDIRSFSEHKVG